MTTEIVPSPEELAWIRRLRRVLKDMPPSVWLFVTGELNVMRRGEDGERVMEPGPGGAVSEEMVLDTIHVDCDGGGW